MVEYLKNSDNKVYCFDNELSESQHADFQAGILNGTYVRDFVAPVGKTELQIAIDGLKDSYIHKRRIDGINAFFYLMSELVIISKANNYPREINKYIERKLVNVRNEVCLGQWLSALEYLDELTVDSYYTQQLHDRVRNTITTYISSNY